MLLGPSGTIARLLASVHAHCNWLDIHAQNVKSKQTKIKKKKKNKERKKQQQKQNLRHIYATSKDFF